MRGDGRQSIFCATMITWFPAIFTRKKTEAMSHIMHSGWVGSCFLNMNEKVLRDLCSSRKTFLVLSVCLARKEAKIKWYPLYPKPWLKIRTANAIFWISLGIFRDYGQKKNFFFRIKTFWFFKIESWNFQHLFDIECGSFRQFFSIRCLTELKFQEIFFLTDAENFSFLSWKTKKFYS